MTLQILLSVVLGIIFGYIMTPEMLIGNIDFVIDVGLCLLLFFVGIDIGGNKSILKDIREYGYKIILVPFMIVIGTLFGSIIASFLINLSLIESAAVGAGLGWYSLSAIELSKYSAKLGTIAFLANVLREITSIIMIPLIAKHIGYIETVAAAGATSMDTALPVITKATNSSISVISFFSGLILTSIVPILVPLIIGLNF
ncbi:Membrane protein of unknown function [Caminicella sporogenes DSM 14501]|uniref:Lysine exporter LysO family protein n=1 Tax=Caminicella sporogenes DSM 14501 TaxID=1121266 RepID=A0A1M6LQ24_9FIRM|nr:lysine exporter LysO family protein [Caminicella sporogenes]RKD27911.1 hypothetical protein BET04_02290 [Caminicella sporogenes]WIF94501.1 lysine exporter LysO family protein [Caminicella sporogenes]SHJ73294.1 Membrane protein of unknown function [Caminicella sporogenes DSM 14501]